MLLETIITIGLIGIGINQERESRDVYKVDVAKTVRMIDDSGVITYGQPPTIMPWGFTSYTSEDSVIDAFKEIGLGYQEGTTLIGVARDVLASRGHNNVKITPVLARDPEEGVSYLTLRFHVNASFEEALSLDSTLTREMVSRVSSIPEKLSFAVYEMETASV